MAKIDSRLFGVVRIFKEGLFSSYPISSDWVDAAGEEEEVDDEVPVDEEREEEEEHLGDELTSILNAIEEEKNAAMEVEEGG